MKTKSTKKEAISTALCLTLLAFCSAMSFSYYKNNYQKVASEYSLKMVGIGQANAAAERSIPVIQSPTLKRNFSKNTLNHNTKVKPTSKKVSSNQKMYMEEVK